MLNFFKLLTKNKRPPELDGAISDGELPAPKPKELRLSERLFGTNAPLIHSDDRSLVGSVLKPDLEHGPWIAGGAALRWYQSQPVQRHDIDIFFRYPEQLKQHQKVICDELNGVEVFNSDHAVTYRVWHESFEYKIQLIKKYFNTLQDCLDQFDVTVCTIATDGRTWVKGPHFDRDFEARALVLQNGLKTDCIKRVVKYMIYGYEPSSELLDAIYSDSSLELRFNDDDEYRM